LTPSPPPPPTAGLTPSTSTTGSIYVYFDFYALRLFCLCYLIRIVHTDDEASHHEGEGNYGETMRVVWINEGGIIDSQSIQMSHETQLKWPPQFQELFDQTHKKKGMNDYISEKTREVASYSRGMEESYGDDSQRLELDPDIWVAASGAPKKGHVYGFRHSLVTTRMISSCSSSVSHVISPFTTPTVLGGLSSAALTMTPT
ncbi:hypothetical protein Taro_033454, partial [Colocasia esculenta]|nr:hypothetical protein [Colocasia esculenta]